MTDTHYSDGRIIQDPVIVIWDDWHAERSGYFRAFWAASPDDHFGSPVIGYCSPGGSYKTIRAAAAEVRKIYPGELIYRNGRLLK